MKARPLLPWVALALLALLAALWAGLMRLGWALPAPTPNLALMHGPLMVSGFLGTLITLERAVALKQKWMFAAPLLTGVGWVLSLAVPALPLGGSIMLLGSIGGVAILTAIVRRETEVFTITMLFGVLAWVVGNILWLVGFPIFQIVIWWQAFLVLTIAGERLELNRVLRPSRPAIRAFSALVALYLAGAIVASFALGLGARLTGIAMLLLSAWFLRNDIAVRNLRHNLSLTRFIAWCLFLGFLWLGFGGLLNLVLGATYAGPHYDAVLHVVFVGFVISMIFGHAPIIFPAILQTAIVFSPAFYGHLALLHVSLVLRVAGDLLSSQAIRQWGGMLNAAAILLFLVVTLIAVRQGMKK